MSFRGGGGNRFGRSRGNFIRSWRGRAGRHSPYSREGSNSNFSRNADNSHLERSPDQHSQNLTDPESRMRCPYSGWKSYFAEEAYKDNHPLLKFIRAFESYFMKSRCYSFSRENLESENSFTIDLRELFADDDIRNDIPDIECHVINFPSKIISCLGLAMHQLLSQELEEEKSKTKSSGEVGSGWSSDEEINNRLNSNDHVHHKMSLMQARLINMEPEVPLRNIKASYYDKFVAISGTVIRVGNIQTRCEAMAFKCCTCGKLQCYSLPDGKYTFPTNCEYGKCMGRRFIADRTSSLTKLIDHQTIKIQESNDGSEDSGRVPRTIECELTGDMIESCVPGDVATVNGIVKIMSSSDGAATVKRDKCLFLIYILAHSVSNQKRHKEVDSSGKQRSVASSTTRVTTVADTSIQADGGLYSRSELDKLVQEVRSQPRLLRLLVASLCPTIFGHEIVKAGLILGLFGGTQRYAQERDRIPVRGDPHVLVVGDPGLGKSQMLRACADVSPRGVYVCGNTTTTSGLTVTLTKEAAGGSECGLEAGALVLSDRGCCCIDEFDKMGSQHQALLEAMEQQSISIAKAGIVCSLPARASVLAAANPVGGHYNKAKTVSENLKMGSALLSRFDLVFILIDKPDEEIDSLLSEHVLAQHVTTGLLTPVANRFIRLSSQTSPTLSIIRDKQMLREHLVLKKDELLDVIPHPVLKAYIGYARSKIHPRLSNQAAKLLQSFYIELRKEHHGPESTPVTTRQLESLIRLSEARARCELREVVSEEDAQDVIEIMQHSMVDTFSDQFGVIDFQRSFHGSGMSCRSVPKKFISVLTIQAERTSSSTFSTQQLRDAAEKNKIPLVNFEELLESLNYQGYLLKLGPGLFKLSTV